MLHAGGCGFAVVDLETTGLHPNYHHRVVEIAVVILGPTFDVEYEWDTLVNPRRDVGASEIHGLTARHLAQAPTFEDIADDLLEMLTGRVFVAHNARFDLSFLAAELSRVETEARCEALCTLQLAAAADLPAKLTDCCAALGVAHENTHTALADAHAVAAALPVLWRRASPVPPSPFACVPKRKRGEWTGRRWTRAEAAAPAPNRGFLARLVERLPSAPIQAVDAPTGAVLAYADVLDRALEDRLLSDQETEALAAVGDEVGLSLEQVSDLHRWYLTSLVSVALSDGQLSDSESADLECVADLLCIDRGTLRSLIEASTPAVRHLASQARTAGFGNDLAGKSVCFTGTSSCCIRGEPLTRAQSEMLATAAGLVVAPRVTKSLDILVVADPNTMSGKAQKARSYGIRVIGERTFWPTLGITID